MSEFILILLGIALIIVIGIVLWIIVGLIGIGMAFNDKYKTPNEEEMKVDLDRDSEIVDEWMKQLE